MNNVERMTMITPMIMMKLNNSNHTPLVKYEYYTISFQESITSTFTFLLNIYVTMFNRCITMLTTIFKSEILRLPPYVFMRGLRWLLHYALGRPLRGPSGLPTCQGSHVFWGVPEISTKFRSETIYFLVIYIANHWTSPMVLMMNDVSRYANRWSWVFIWTSWEKQKNDIDNSPWTPRIYF